MARKRKSLTNARRAKIFTEAGGRCAICTVLIRPGEAWELDHTLSLELGGADDETNLCPAHVRCHKQKTHKEDRPLITKSTRVRKKHLGLKTTKGRPMMGTKASGWKKPFNGPPVRRDEE